MGRRHVALSVREAEARLGVPGGSRGPRWEREEMLAERYEGREGERERFTS